jgi:hypothetical protein
MFFLNARKQNDGAQAFCCPYERILQLEWRDCSIKCSGLKKKGADRIWSGSGAKESGSGAKERGQQWNYTTGNYPGNITIVKVTDGA